MSATVTHRSTSRGKYLRAAISVVLEKMTVVAVVFTVTVIAPVAA
jgi:hypothetical protein